LAMDRIDFMDAVLLGIAIGSKESRARVQALTSLREKAPAFFADMWKALTNRGAMVALLHEWRIVVGEKEPTLEAILRWAEERERKRTNERVVRTLLSRAGMDDFDLERELEAALARVKVPVSQVG